MKDTFLPDSQTLEEADKLEAEAAAKFFQNDQAEQKSTEPVTTKQVNKKHKPTSKPIHSLFSMVSERCEFFVTPDQEPHPLAFPRMSHER